MDRLRVACVRYLNTAPLVEGLDKLPELELIPAVPSRIAGLVASGEADLGLVSIVDAVRAQAPLCILPLGMIGCDGPTLTVRVFSRVPMERVSTLHADVDSHTSVLLARVLLASRFGIRPSVAPFELPAPPSDGVSAPTPSIAWPETLLLIGDKVVTNRPPDGLYPHQLDLGEAWKSATGLPFVYAAWMCRRERENDATIRVASALLARQLRHNRTRLDWIIASRAPEAGWPIELARHYLGELLRYEVGPREREAVTRFLEQARQLGLLSPSEAGSPRWAPSHHADMARAEASHA